MGHESRREERTSKAGPSVEAIAVGRACGRLYAVTVTDRQSVMFVLDITNPEQAYLAATTHVSPASKDKGAALAYLDRSLGDIGVLSIVFVEAEDSPSGHAGVFMGGKHSGTATFMEFVDEDGNKCGTGHYDEDHDDPTVTISQFVGGTVGGFFGGLLIAAAFTYCVVVPRAKEKGQVARDQHNINITAATRARRRRPPACPVPRAGSAAQVDRNEDRRRGPCTLISRQAHDPQRRRRSSVQLSQASDRRIVSSVMTGLRSQVAKTCRVERQRCEAEPHSITIYRRMHSLTPAELRLT